MCLLSHFRRHFFRLEVNQTSEGYSNTERSVNDAWTPIDIGSYGGATLPTYVSPEVSVVVNGITRHSHPVL